MSKEGPVQDVIDAWKAKDYTKVAAGLVVGFAAGVLGGIILRILGAVVALVAIFVFDWNPVLWTLAGLLFVYDPMIFIDLWDLFYELWRELWRLISSPLRRSAQAEASETPSRDRGGARRFIVPGIVGLVAIAYLIAR